MNCIHGIAARASAVVILTCCAACSSTPAEPGGGERAQTPQNEVTASADVPGYQHTLAHSRFDVGPNPREYAEYGWSKTNGPDGIFSVNLDNHAARAIPHPSSPALQAGPYGSSLQEHNDHVLAYFVGCGIPRDQIASVDGSPEVETGGSPSDTTSSSFKLVSYTSSLVRAADGIPVVDSVAWARFNATDQVVRETVYWPAIPGQVLADAEALRTKLSDPTALAAFQAHLPAGATGSRVVIRHRGMDNHNGSFGAAAVYDVIDGQVVRHFDANGQEEQLPWE